MREPKWEKSHSSAQNVTRAFLHQVTWIPWEEFKDPLRRNSIQVHKVWRVFLTSSSLKHHERTHTDAQNVTRASRNKTSLRIMRGPKQERSLSNVQSVTKAWPTQDYFSMIKVWQELLNSWPLQGTWDPTWERSLSNAQSVTRASRNPTSFLKNYERTNTGEKPFKCSKCEKSFLKSDPWANPQLREAIYKRMQKHGQFFVVCSRIGWSGQPHLLTQKCNIKT